MEWYNLLTYRELEILLLLLLSQYEAILVLEVAWSLVVELLWVVRLVGEVFGDDWRLQFDQNYYYYYWSMVVIAMIFFSFFEESHCLHLFFVFVGVCLR